MKTFLLTCICSLALAAGVFAQSPTVSPASSVPAGGPTAAATASPESALEKSIRNKHKKHFNIRIGGHDLTGEDSEDKSTERGDHDIPALVVPIVAVVFLSIFGAPVLIVAVILYFGFSKTRMQHRTVRMLVEKGQPVPPELLRPPEPAQRQRSDMRRGVVLMMVGLGLTIFLGAVNEWENGSWAIGIIPFLIGAGYLLVWKLEGGKPKADKPPALP